MDHVPIGKFRDLETFDRSEIESFKSIKNLICEYLNSTEISKPLSIAVFGTPGSGKSFGISQVAESIAPGNVKKVEFNLSQFKSSDDLIAAFHRVRDISLSGKIPLVFFDEFDANFNGKLGWLKYFLMPMQDGEFREGETVHPIGRAIFVFAGSTSKTFAEFIEGHKEGEISSEKKEKDNLIQNNKSCEVNENKQEKKTVSFDKEFINVKGPDFASRLRGYVNIKGPNPINDDEKLYVVNRAMKLRSLFHKNASQIFDSNNKCLIDSGVLRAFIKIWKYKHGVRSMQAIIEMSTLSDKKSFEQSSLPPPEQLEMHVNAEEFYCLVLRDVLFGAVREELAQALHEKFLKDHKNEKPSGDLSMVPWEELRKDLKESNRQQADHIPVKLKTIGYDFAPRANRKQKIIKFTKKEIEIIAKLEHERFVTERFLQGWKLGKPRNVKKKISPYLVEWEHPNMTEEIKEYDRKAVRAIPEILKKANFEIYPLKKKEQKI